MLAEAHRIAMTHPRGPVFVSVPEDDWDRPAEPVAPRTVHAEFTADPRALAALAARLDACARPALVVGPGVDDEHALPEVLALAERLRAAVWISPLSGRSGFPESHPLFQGFLPPVADRLTARLEPYDTTIVFVTHDMDESVYVGDRVVVLSPGPGSHVVLDLPLELPADRDQITTRALPEFVALRARVGRAVRGHAPAEEDRTAPEQPLP
ncbi:hypothetical protein [Streptomyces sp. NPDC059786]|uniref:hypothetical protein n=1 Tax=Streptomyces sp. NPDC059786 TaxID=3346946 RepID=UPI0036499345